MKARLVKKSRRPFLSRHLYILMISLHEYSIGCPIYAKYQHSTVKIMEKLNWMNEKSHLNRIWIVFESYFVAATDSVNRTELKNARNWSFMTLTSDRDIRIIAIETGRYIQCIFEGSTYVEIFGAPLYIIIVIYTYRTTQINNIKKFNLFFFAARKN